MKKTFSILMMIAMLMLCVGSFAENPEQIVSTTESGTVSLESPSRLASGYISRIMKQNGTVNRDPRPFGTRLTGREKKLYDFLADKIVKIAAGQLASTEFEIAAEQIFDQESYTFEELGCTTISEASKILQNSREVLNALLQDYPYEMYWFDKTTGTSSSMSFYSGENSIQPVKITYKMAVASSYQNGGTYVMNTTFGTSAAAAAQNAQAIIAKYHGQSNLKKLNGYREEICKLVSYNNAAAAGGVSYGNPWQMIWVFDGDDTTTVVCEGYSKAFKYLCDNTSFAGGISVVCVSGTMDGGNHMWNLVKMTDGKNYLADITNCDEGTVGYPDELFLCGYSSGDASSGYIYTANGHGIRYVYGSDISSLFLAGELDVAGAAYTGADPVMGPALAAPTVAVAEYVLHGTDLPMTLTGEGIEYAIITITDQNGNQVLHNQFEGTSITVPTGPLENGTYKVSVQAGSSTNEPSDPTTVTITINNIGDDPAATVTASLKVFWDDQDDFDGIRPKTLGYLLNGERVTPVVTDWTAVMENLPKYENDTLIPYNWTIELPAGYEMTDSQASGYRVTVTLTHRHAHSYQATFNWSEDASACKVTLTCEKGDDMVMQDATVTSEVTQAATCSAEGVRTFTATLIYDGKTYTGKTTRAIAMIPHTTGITKPGHPATCTEEGLTDEIGCTVCHQVSQAQVAIPALGHDPVHHDAQAPTCSAVGWDAYDTCSRCDYTTYAEKPALGHITVTDAAVAATCTETGLTEGSHCSVCGAVITEQQTVPATGHTAVTDVAVAATCTETGLTEGSHCSVCGAVISAQQIIPALGHAYGTPTFTWNGTEACTLTLACAHENTHTVAMDATIHSEVTIEPGDTTEGLRTYTAAATYEGKTYTDTKTEAIPALMVIENGVLVAYNGTASAITIPNTVTAIGAGAFQGMSNITSVTIPTSVTTIEAHAFAGTGITEVAIEATVTNIGEGAFNTGVTFDTPYDSPAAEWAAANGGVVNSTTETPMPELTIGDTFESSDGLMYKMTKKGEVSFLGLMKASSKTKVTIPPTVSYAGTEYKVTDIAPKALNKDTKVKTLVIGKNVKTIGKSAFASCTKLKTIKDGSAVTTIGDSAFSGDKALKTVPTMNKVTKIGNNAFKGCAALTKFTLGSKVKTIGKNAFASCTKLATVSGGAAVTTIGDSAFSGDKTLKSFPIMKKLQKIGANAFKNCGKLASFTLGSAVNSIGKNGFNGCGALKTITVKTTKLNDKNVGAAAFKGINKGATFKCPKKKLDDYKKLFIKKGAPKTCKFVVGKDTDKE